MNRVRLLFVFLLVVIIDQITKTLILNYMSNNIDEINILPFLGFTLVLNSGVAFGMFSEIGKISPILFSLFAILVAVLLLLWSLYNKQSYFCLGLIAGGAVGNAIDRLRIGAVVDFIDVYYNSFHWPVFNIADSAITIGVVMMLIDMCREEDSKGTQRSSKP